jgi:hypothetical protein
MVKALAERELKRLAEQAPKKVKDEKVTTKAQKQEVRTNRLVFKMFKFVY